MSTSAQLIERLKEAFLKERTDRDAYISRPAGETLTVWIESIDKLDALIEELRDVLSAAKPIPVDASADSLLVSGMRRWPTGDVRHYPDPPIGMSGTSTRGFLAEYDAALTEAYRRGFQDGHRVGLDDALVVSKNMESWK